MPGKTESPMIYLVLSILSSTLIVLIFKLFQKFEIQTFQAIVFNYITCFICGWIAMGKFPVSSETLQVTWLPYALVLGSIFILTFNIIATTVHHFGITISSIMQRMSLVLTVPFAIIAYNEPLPFLKIIGLAAAFLAIVFANMPNRREAMPKHLPHGWMWLFPSLILLFSGIIEIVLLYVERSTAGEANLLFTTFIFGTAGLLGCLYVGFNLIIGKTKLAWRNLLAGICLGLPNFGSIYFVLKALNVGWGGSVVFPVNNVAVIGLAVLAAWLFFAEKLSKINILGVVLAMISIALIAIAR